MSILTTIIVVLSIGIAFLVGRLIGSYRKDKEWKENLPYLKKDAIAKSRAIIGGQFSEQLAPFLPGFKWLPTECKFLGKPIDLIVFKGADERNIEEVIFVEIKSGKSKLSKHETNLKETIEKKRVRWEEYRIPDELTMKKNSSSIHSE